ncbi:hypothetical protein ACFL2O_05925 [Thermodesulfobacteriota bacterium]
MKKTKKIFLGLGLFLLGLTFCGLSTGQYAWGSGPNSLSLQSETHKVIQFENKAPAMATVPLDITTPLEVSGLGPQPEPPDSPADFDNPSDLAKVSPQPEPPSKQSKFQNPANTRMFNPQPEPPAKPTAGTPMPIPPSSSLKVETSVEVMGFNPQPEPPGKGYFMNLYKGEVSQNSEVGM